MPVLPSLRYFIEMLKIPAISPDADFFDLGVTSLNLIEIAELLHEQQGIDVPVEMFLDHTTLQALPSYLQEPAACCCAATRSRGSCLPAARPRRLQPASSGRYCP